MILRIGFLIRVFSPIAGQHAKPRVRFTEKTERAMLGLFPEQTIVQELRMSILIDADGCPVVDITIKLAREKGIDCVILCDTSHVFERPGVSTITVSKGNDSVDFALVNRVKPGDIVVTQDYGLAAMCLARLAIPVSQDGMIYTDDNMDALLNARHLAKRIRMAGGRLKGSAKRTPAQNIAFERALRMLLSPADQR